MVSMNSKIAIVIVALIVLAGIGGAVYFTSQTNTDTTSGVQPGQPSGGDQGDGQAATVQSLAELLASGKAQECNFSDENDQSRSEGVMFFGSGKMRGDFVSVTDGQTFNSHMIVQGTDVYIWTDGMNSGFKTSVDATSEAQADNSQTVDFDKQVDYECNPWAIDNSRFE